MPETKEVTATQVAYDLAEESEKEGFHEISTPSGSANGVGNQAPNFDKTLTVGEMRAEKKARLLREPEDLAEEEDEARKEEEKELRKAEEELKNEEREVNELECQLKAARARVQEHQAEVAKRIARVASLGQEKQPTYSPTTENAPTGTQFDDPTASILCHRSRQAGHQVLHATQAPASSNIAAAAQQRDSTQQTPFTPSDTVNDPSSAAIYSALDASRKEIRLVTLKCGGKSSQLQCFLTTISLSDCPKYEALSYVWGDPTVRSGILLNGHQFSVTRNLAVALEFLRSEIEERTLWIDALCIDQSNIDERNAQVRLMRFIYQSAQRVVSWIGDADEYTFNAVRLIGEAVEDGFSPDWMRGSMLHIGRAWWELAMFLEMQRREYWRRVWITQEIACAKDGVIQCGHFTVPFWALRKFVEVAECSFDLHTVNTILEKFDHGSVTGYVKIIQILHNHEISNGPKEGTSLLHLLEQNHQKLASDPRDKVYALLGLSDLSSSAHYGLQIDYGKSVRDVYIGLVQGVVEETSSLNIICASHPGSDLGQLRQDLARLGRVRQTNLPSWTPDWGYWTRESLRTHASSQNAINKAASGSPPSISFQVTEGIMNVVGFRVGLVSICGKRHEVYNIERLDKHYGEVFSGMLEWRKFLFDVVDCSRETELLFLQNITMGHLSPDQQLEFLAFFKAWERSTVTDYQKSEFAPSDTRKTYLEMVQIACEGSQFFLNRRLTVGKQAAGHNSDFLMGICSDTVSDGDIICVFLGCDFPVVIRPVEDYFVFVAAVYIHSLMDGKAMDGLEEGVYELESFELH